MTHGFILRSFEDDSSKVVPLSVVGSDILPVCFVEFGVNVLEYVAAAAVEHVMIINFVEIMHGSIDDLVRYSRIGCAHVLSFPMVGPPALLVLTFCQLWVDYDVLQEMAVDSSLLSRGNELLKHVGVLCVAGVSPAWCICGIHNFGPSK